MALLDRFIKETAEALGVDIAEVDWITEESLEAGLFDAEEDLGEPFDEKDGLEAAAARAITCLPLDRYGPKAKITSTGRYCYGKTVYTWSARPNNITKGYNVIVHGSTMSWKAVRDT